MYSLFLPPPAQLGDAWVVIVPRSTEFLDIKLFFPMLPSLVELGVVKLSEVSFSVIVKCVYLTSESSSTLAFLSATA